MEDNSRYIARKALGRSLPQSLAATAIIKFMTIVNTIIAANFLGVEAMTVITLSLPIWILFKTIYDSVADTASVFFSDAQGKNDKLLGTKRVNQLFWTMISIESVMAIMLMLFTPHIASLLGASPELVANS